MQRYRDGSSGPHPTALLNQENLETAWDIIEKESRQQSTSGSRHRLHLHNASRVKIRAWPNLNRAHHGLRRRVYFGKHYAKGIAAFREKRPSRF